MQFISFGQWGEHAFLRAYNSLPIPQQHRAAAIARWLDVTPGTVRDWISGRRAPPRAVCFALWLESAEGRAAMHCQLFNEARAHAGHARSLDDAMRAQTATIDALRRELDAVKRARPGPSAANDGAYLDCPPPGRPAPAGAGRAAAQRA